MEKAMIAQHTATKIRILRVVFLKILLFRLRFIPRPPWGSACFLVTSPSLLFWMISADKQHKKPLVPCTPA